MKKVTMIHKPLNEPILGNDQRILGGYWYVIDGRPKLCEYFADQQNSGISVAECKHRFGFSEIRRYDKIGRVKRDQNKSMSSADVPENDYPSYPPESDDCISTDKTKQIRRRPRNSFAIRPVR